MSNKNQPLTTPAIDSARRSETAEITLMIATDCPSLRKTLLARLDSESGLRVEGTPIATGSDLRSRLAERCPAVLLLDSAFLSRAGANEPPLHLQFPCLSVLLVGDAVGPGIVEQVVENHFRGFLLTGEPDLLPRAIRCVAQGELWLPRPLLAEAISRYLQRRSELNQPMVRADQTQISLTEREVEVVKALRNGLANKEIADDLGIEEDTVKKHLHNIYRKLGIRRRSQLFARIAAS